MAKKMLNLCFEIFDASGDYSNADEIFMARSEALRAGCSYLVKVRSSKRFEVIEHAFQSKTDACAFAAKTCKDKGSLWCAVYQMHGEKVFFDGANYRPCSLRYAYLQHVKDYEGE